jgi:hypothetical protein
VVAVAFQITFCAEMHANDVFLFFKNYFWHQHIKTIQNVQTILNFSKKKKKIEFFGNAVCTAFPNAFFISVQLKQIRCHHMLFIISAQGYHVPCYSSTSPDLRLRIGHMRMDKTHFISQKKLSLCSFCCIDCFSLSCNDTW